jgi:type III restriction enzyme
VGKQWYAIQGWHQYKIRPDWWRQEERRRQLDLVYIIESKGEHLLGNVDSEYKKSVLDLMTEQHKTNRIERYQMKQLELFQLNENVECFFVEEKKEEESLRNLFK